MPPSPCLAFWGTCMSIRDEDTAAMTFLLESGWKEGYISVQDISHSLLVLIYFFLLFCFILFGPNNKQDPKGSKISISRKDGLQSFCKDLCCGKRKTSQGWVRHNLGTADAACSGQSGLGGTV